MFLCGDKMYKIVIFLVGVCVIVFLGCVIIVLLKGVVLVGYIEVVFVFLGFFCYFYMVFMFFG